MSAIFKINSNYLFPKAYKFSSLRVSIARLSQKTPGVDQSKKAQLPGEYKSKEYYDFNQYSFYDIEKEMVKHRLPQPSSLPKTEYTWSQSPPNTIKKK